MSAAAVYPHWSRFLSEVGPPITGGPQEYAQSAPDYTAGHYERIEAEIAAKRLELERLQERLTMVDDIITRKAEAHYNAAEIIAARGALAEHIATQFSCAGVAPFATIKPGRG